MIEFKFRMQPTGQWFMFGSFCVATTDVLEKYDVPLEAADEIAEKQRAALKQMAYSFTDSLIRKMEELTA